MAFIDMGDQFLALSEGRRQGPDDLRHFGLVVDDRAQLRALAERAGARMVEGSVQLLRPVGNRVEVVEYRDVQFYEGRAQFWIAMQLSLDGIREGESRVEREGDRQGSIDQPRRRPWCIVEPGCNWHPSRWLRFFLSRLNATAGAPKASWRSWCPPVGVPSGAVAARPRPGGVSSPSKPRALECMFGKPSTPRLRWLRTWLEPGWEILMLWSIPIGTIAGTVVRIHVTFLLFLVWIGAAQWRVGGREAALEGVAFLVLIFACVLAHEFGHIFAARRYGIRTPEVTLWPIGGVASLERIPEKPSEELVVALRVRP